MYISNGAMQTFKFLKRSISDVSSDIESLAKIPPRVGYREVPPAKGTVHWHIVLR